jgi:hypothetical protein
MPNWIPIVSDIDRKRVKGWVGKAPPGTMIAFKKHDARSIEQNALLWSRLSEISEKVEWYGEKLPPYCWKDIFTASLHAYKVVPGLNPNTRVPLGLRTSSMSRKEMTALLELISAFAAERGVMLSDESEANNA